jgi:hypothetical protein
VEQLGAGLVGKEDVDKQAFFEASSGFLAAGGKS